MKQGRLITNNVILERHEMSTVNFLLNYGYDIELIRPSLTPHSKNADLIMEGLVWEMKCPQGKSRHCVERLFRRAAHQSEHLIIDLRLVKIDAKIAETTVQRLFKQSRRMRRMIVIIKSNQLLDFIK